MCDRKFVTLIASLQVFKGENSNILYVFSLNTYNELQKPWQRNISTKIIYLNKGIAQV